MSHLPPRAPIFLPVFLLSLLLPALLSPVPPADLAPGGQRWARGWARPLPAGPSLLLSSPPPPILLDTFWSPSQARSSIRRTLLFHHRLRIQGAERRVLDDGLSYRFREARPPPRSCTCLLPEVGKVPESPDMHPGLLQLSCPRPSPLLYTHVGGPNLRDTGNTSRLRTGGRAHPHNQENGVSLVTPPEGEEGRSS